MNKKVLASYTSSKLTVLLQREQALDNSVKPINPLHIIAHPSSNVSSWNAGYNILLNPFSDFFELLDISIYIIFLFSP